MKIGVPIYKSKTLQASYRGFVFSIFVLGTMVGCRNDDKSVVDANKTTSKNDSVTTTIENGLAQFFHDQVSDVKRKIYEETYDKKNPKRELSNA